MPGIGRLRNRRRSLNGRTLLSTHNSLLMFDIGSRAKKERVRHCPQPSSREEHAREHRRTRRQRSVSYIKRLLSSSSNLIEVDMSIWIIAPVTDEPEAVLILWCIFETDKDTRHFVGYDGVAEACCRSSSSLTRRLAKERRRPVASISFAAPAAATATRTTCGGAGVPHAGSRRTKTCRNR
jgi:hypothetical protein